MKPMHPTFPSKTDPSFPIWFSRSSDLTYARQKLAEVSLLTQSNVSTTTQDGNTITSIISYLDANRVVSRIANDIECDRKDRIETLQKIYGTFKVTVRHDKGSRQYNVTKIPVIVSSQHGVEHAWTVRYHTNRVLLEEFLVNYKANLQLRRDTLHSLNNIKDQISSLTSTEKSLIIRVHRSQRDSLQNVRDLMRTSTSSYLNGLCLRPTFVWLVTSKRNGAHVHECDTYDAFIAWLKSEPTNYTFRQRELKRKGRVFELHQVPGYAVARQRAYGAGRNQLAYRVYNNGNDVFGSSAHVSTYDCPDYSISFPVHTQHGDFLRLAKYRRAAEIKKQKKPVTEARHVGLELEFFFPRIPTDKDSSTRAIERLANALTDAGLHKNVNVGTDGSIEDFDTSECTSAEIRILAAEDQVDDVIKRTTKVLREFKARVNKSCGFHVHLDCRYGTGRNATEVFQRLYAAQPLLYAMVDPSRVGNEFCLPNKNKRWSPGRRAESRYHAINTEAYSKYNTIEVRLHQGTTNATKILNWVKILVSIADGKKFDRFPGRLHTIARQLGWSEELVKYIASRIKTFAAKTGEAPKFIETKKRVQKKAQNNATVLTSSTSAPAVGMSDPTPGATEYNPMNADAPERVMNY